MQIITPQTAVEGPFITRASGATFRTSEGLLSLVGNDIARPIFSGNDWTGIYQEGAETQLLTQVTDFANAYWTKTSSTVAAGQSDPTGGTSAYVLTGSVSSSRIQRAGIASGSNTASIFAKAGSTSALEISDGTTSATFDLTAGTSVGGAIESYASGWYRCSLAYTASGSHTISYTVGVGGIDIYGANVCPSALSTYINGSNRAAETQSTPTAATIVYNSVPDDTYDVWQSGDSFDTGDRVIRNRKIYQSAIDSNTADPLAGVLEAPKTWVLVSVLNKLKMFDLSTGEDTATTNPNEIEVIIYYPSIFNGVSLVNVAGASALMEILNPGDSQPSESIVVPLVSTFGINSWYKWYFEPRTSSSRAVRLNLGGSAGSFLRVKLSRSGNTARLGKLVSGVARNIGQTLGGVSIRTVDQSPNERNEFGNVTLQPGRVTTISNFTVSVPFRQTDGITELAKSLASTNTVFIGEEAEGYGVTITYGYAQEYEATLVPGPQATYRITVESI